MSSRDKNGTPSVEKLSVGAVLSRGRIALRPVVRSVFAALGRLLGQGEEWLTSSKKSLYGLAVMRIVVGLTALGLLVSNFSTRIYSLGSGSAWTAEGLVPMSPFSSLPVFSFMHMIAYNDLVFTIVYVVIMVLAVALVVGFRTRLVLPVFFVLFVGWLELNSMVGDQSDNLGRVVLFFMLFADVSSRWSLDARRRRRWSGYRGNIFLRLWRGQPVLPSWFTTAVHNLVIVLLVFQIIVVYMAGGLFKAGGEPWQNGTAVWGPLNAVLFSPFPALTELVTGWGVSVALITIGTVLVQVAFPFLLLTRWTRILALFVMFTFHVGIGVLMGLPWFSMWMFAVDAVLIRDRSYRALARFVRGILRPSSASAYDDEPTREPPKKPASEAGAGETVAPWMTAGKATV